YTICENEDSVLLKLPCYKNVSLTALRKSALRTLSACQHLKAMSHKIFNVLYKALISPDTELQECAYDCMKKYKYLNNVNPEVIRTTVRNFIINISEVRLLSPKDHLLIQRLKNLARLFASLFNDKLCELMLQHLNRSTDICCQFLRRHREKEYEFRVKSQQPEQSEMIKSNLMNVENQIPLYLNLGADIIYLFCEISAAD
ncbi:hypothetical protein BLA29_011542, partial [Euroglyphus maynei]